MDNIASVPATEPARLLGAHMPTAGGLYKSLVSGKEIGCTAVQLFTGNPRQWVVPPLDPAVTEQFLKAREETAIAFTVAHDSYLINLAAPDAAILERSRKAFHHELQRANELEIPWVVTHLGSYLDGGEEAGMNVLVQSLLMVLSQTEGMLSGIAMETTAGQGTGIGYQFEQLARLLDETGRPDRLGVCLDTCHIFAAGYDIRSEEAYNSTIEKFNDTIGLQTLKVIHANDAKKPLGSRVDRHEHLGDGEIGLPTFGRLVNDPRLLQVPIVIETPQSETMHAVNLGKLKKLATGVSAETKVNVRFFGHYSDFAPDGLTLTLPMDATLVNLSEKLAAQDARFEGLASSCRIAVNEEFAEPDAELSNGDNVAYIPPMSGG